MAIFGWLLLVAGTVVCSLIGVAMIWYCLPSHNPVGGAKNSGLNRVIAVCYCGALIWLWVWLFEYAPFSVVIK